MDKEKLVTIVLGLVVGVAIAGIYFAAVRFLPQLGGKPAPISFTPPPKGNATTSLVVDEPADESAVKESPVTASGKAPAAAKIVVFSPAEERIASADASGKFSLTIKLEEGENEISFSLLNDSTVAATIKRNVILEINQ